MISAVRLISVPHFLLFPIILAVLLWLAIAAIVLLVSPSPWLIACFLLLVFAGLFFAISLFRYFVVSFLARRPRDPQEVYRAGFRFSALVSLAITLYLLLRIWRAASFLNVALLVATAVLVVMMIMTRL